MRIKSLAVNGLKSAQGRGRRDGGRDGQLVESVLLAREEAVASCGLKKGLAIVYLREFVKRYFGEVVWKDLVDVFPGPERDLLNERRPRPRPLSEAVSPYPTRPDRIATRPL